MEIYFNSHHTFLLFLLCVLIAGTFSFLLYRKSKKDSPLTSIQINLLSVLRFLTVFFISLLFLQLAIQRMKHSKQKQELIIGIDNSESLQAFGNQVKSLKDKLTNELQSFDPQFLLFDSKTHKSDSLNFAGNWQMRSNRCEPRSS